MERLVTRTLTKTTGTAALYNVERGEVYEEEFAFFGRFLNEQDLIDKIQANHDPKQRRVVAITRQCVEKILYGMTEDEFAQCAQELPPNYRRAFNSTYKYSIRNTKHPKVSVTSVPAAKAMYKADELPEYMNYNKCYDKSEYESILEESTTLNDICVLFNKITTDLSVFYMQKITE